jgi:hypothetical protein
MAKMFLVVVEDEMALTASAALELISRAGVQVTELSASQHAMKAVAPLVPAAAVPTTMAPVNQSDNRPRSSTRLRAQPGDGSRPLAPGHVRHNWAPTDEAGTDHCLKCGMVRQQLEKGVLRFIDRNDGIYDRPPFKGETPSCDEALSRRRIAG